MKPIVTMPNGEQIDLLDDSINGMEYVCCVCGEYETPISGLLEDYKRETNKQRRLQISDEIRDQAYYFAGQIGAFDEDLQQMISWSDLGEEFYQSLLKYAQQ
jgi:hypothetical protein